MDISTRAPEPSLVARCSASGLRLSSAARCTLHALRRPRPVPAQSARSRPVSVWWLIVSDVGTSLTNTH